MHDVIIIGAGVVGCCIARELSRYDISVLVLEKGEDVAVGASKANSGIVHAGYDAKPGTQKAHFNMLGVAMFEQAAQELGFALNMCGSFVICTDEADMHKLEALKERGEANGVPGLKIIDGDRMRQLEPMISEKVAAALHAPTGGIISPYEMTLSYAENAASNGVKFEFNTEVTNIEKHEHFTITTATGARFETRVVINAAGVYADAVNNMVSDHKIEIVARKGEYIMLDKLGTIHSTIFQLPTKMGKGVLVSPTIDGNIILGPTAIDVDDKDDTAATSQGLREIMQNALISTPDLKFGHVISSFAGLRAHSTGDDFIIGETPDVQGFVNVAGIESPGLTSAPAIAKHIEGIVAPMLNATPNPNFNPIRQAPFNFRRASNEERAAAIAKNPDYGRIVCRCELVTVGEIVDAAHSPVPALNLDALKRRTRLGMGRCQGGFCSGSAVKLLADELGISLSEVTKSGGNSRILYDR